MKPQNSSRIFPSHPVTTDKDLDVLIDKIADARVVLLGEASHGTSEYYTWRAAITKRLIVEKGFSLIAVEGEWADSYRVNNFIKGNKQDSLAAVSLLKQFDRWPTWMWANEEIASLITWLNEFNASKPFKKKTGFFGLDVYCLWESMTELLPYIRSRAPELVPVAENLQRCFQPFGNDAQQYAYAVARNSADCGAETKALWNSLSKFPTHANEGIDHFVMQQNALVALNGERYFSSMATGEDVSWNIRDRHMMQTLKRLLDFHGDSSKVIVWEHNTHVGDARFTDMAAAGLVNVGQLAREEYGNKVFIIGFGSYQGSVIAANSWGAQMQNMTVPPAIRNSWEHLLHADGGGNKILFSSEIESQSILAQPVPHRAIGVVYRPHAESGNYVPTIIPKRYDAFFFIDKTTALKPLKIKPRQEPPDTYPTGY